MAYSKDTIPSFLPVSSTCKYSSAKTMNGEDDEEPIRRCVSSQYLDQLTGVQNHHKNLYKQNRNLQSTISNLKDQLSLSEFKRALSEMKNETTRATVEKCLSISERMIKMTSKQMAEHDLSICKKLDTSLNHYADSIMEIIASNLADTIYEPLLRKRRDNPLKIKDIIDEYYYSSIQTRLNSITDLSNSKVSDMTLSIINDINRDLDDIQKTARITLINESTLDNKYQTNIPDNWNSNASYKLSFSSNNGEDKYELDLPTLDKSFYDLIYYCKRTLRKCTRDSNTDEGNKTAMWPE
ncbi:uncharacterized protein IL334_006403 [Kwoniella shivajii]|uniref:Uncharacterized protein n=1 Tax=Kwoniella shivajii TaxID=564305 RepID=A0ABZ1D9T2_9TREE|nr:hypothetical protein IL334_006403 [Kwoniella shivajii]